MEPFPHRPNKRKYQRRCSVTEHTIRAVRQLSESFLFDDDDDDDAIQTSERSTTHCVKDELPLTIGGSATVNNVLTGSCCLEKSKITADEIGQVTKVYKRSKGTTEALPAVDCQKSTLGFILSQRFSFNEDETNDDIDSHQTLAGASITITSNKKSKVGNPGRVDNELVGRVQTFATVMN